VSQGVPPPLVAQLVSELGRDRLRSSSLWIELRILGTFANPKSSLQSSICSPSPAFPSQSFVYEVLRQKVRFENNGTGRTETLLHVLVQNDAGVQQRSCSTNGSRSTSRRGAPS